MSEKAAKTSTHDLDPLELNRIAPPDECERLSGAAWDTLRRRYPNKVIRISARRVGMRVRDALMLEQAS